MPLVNRDESNECGWRLRERIEPGSIGGKDSVVRLSIQRSPDSRPAHHRTFNVCAKGRWQRTERGYLRCGSATPAI